uniref:Uncharacterized protein n=1 Tax=Oryza punctata TaxID=4537 RepID=A0A0E0LG40_ORYPU
RSATTRVRLATYRYIVDRPVVQHYTDRSIHRSAYGKNGDEAGFGRRGRRGSSGAACHRGGASGGRQWRLGHHWKLQRLVRLPKVLPRRLHPVHLPLLARRRRGLQGQLRRLLTRQRRRLLHRRQHHRQARRPGQALLHLRRARPLRRRHEARGHRRRRHQAQAQEGRLPRRRPGDASRRLITHRGDARCHLAHWISGAVGIWCVNHRHERSQGCRDARHRDGLGLPRHVRVRPAGLHLINFGLLNPFP